LTVPDQILGRRVLAIEALTRPWATAVETNRVTLVDGRVVVYQAGLPTTDGRAGIARRMRVGRALGAAAPGLGVPAVLDGDAAAAPPFLVTAFVPGRGGSELLGSRADALVLARVAGDAARSVAAVPARALRTALPRTWANAQRLGLSAGGWLAGASLGLHDTAAALGVLDRIPALFAEPPVLAHGDLAPVNLVLDGERLAGLLDLERVRVAPAGFDAAWFRLMVRHHHPERWPDVGPAFLAATGLGEDLTAVRRLDDLAVLACLEQLASLPRRSPGREAWATRAREVLRREPPRA
jgi:aminoglycoside phosphotransferase (APT) family kinase protein